MLLGGGAALASLRVVRAARHIPAKIDDLSGGAVEVVIVGRAICLRCKRCGLRLRRGFASEARRSLSRQRCVHDQNLRIHAVDGDRVGVAKRIGTFGSVEV